MKKIMTIACALIAGAAMPAFADDTAYDSFTGQITADANAAQVRNILLSKNYTNVSKLHRDEEGNWVGTAVKDGKVTMVSVHLPGNRKAAETN